MITKKSIKVRDNISKILAYIILIIASLLVLIPFLIILSTSFKSITEAQTLPFYLIPKEFSVDAYISTLSDKRVWLGLRNTLIVGNIFCMLWGVIYLTSSNFYFFLVAEFILALGFALKGVSESPLLYTTLKKLGRIQEFAKIESKGSTLYFIFEALASIAAGYLYFINPYLPLIFSVTCSLIATILSFYMKTKRSG